MSAYGYIRQPHPDDFLDVDLGRILDREPASELVREDWMEDGSRPMWSSIVDDLCPGDTVVATDVLHMFGSADEAEDLYPSLARAGVNLSFVDAPSPDTDHVLFVSHAASLLDLRNTSTLSDKLTANAVTTAVDHALWFYISDMVRCRWAEERERYERDN